MLSFATLFYLVQQIARLLCFVEHNDFSCLMNQNNGNYNFSSFFVLYKV